MTIIDGTTAEMDERAKLTGNASERTRQSIERDIRDEFIRKISGRAKRYRLMKNIRFSFWVSMVLFFTVGLWLIGLVSFINWLFGWGH